VGVWVVLIMEVLCCATSSQFNDIHNAMTAIFPGTGVRLRRAIAAMLLPCARRKSRPPCALLSRSEGDRDDECWASSARALVHERRIADHPCKPDMSAHKRAPMSPPHRPGVNSRGEITHVRPSASVSPMKPVNTSYRSSY
jgi:hypothetical protein